jgi:hypothetical protein
LRPFKIFKYLAVCYTLVLLLLYGAYAQRSAILNLSFSLFISPSDFRRWPAWGRGRSAILNLSFSLSYLPILIQAMASMEGREKRHLNLFLNLYLPILISGDGQHGEEGEAPF